MIRWETIGVFHFALIILSAVILIFAILNNEDKKTDCSKLFSCNLRHLLAVFCEFSVYPIAHAEVETSSSSLSGILSSFAGRTINIYHYANTWNQGSCPAAMCQFSLGKDTEKKVFIIANAPPCGVDVILARQQPSTEIRKTGQTHTTHVCNVSVSAQFYYIIYVYVGSMSYQQKNKTENKNVHIEPKARVDTDYGHVNWTHSQHCMVAYFINITAEKSATVCQMSTQRRNRRSR